MKRQYEVYHTLLRDAQIYTGDCSSDEINNHNNNENWRDYKGDPLMDIIFAEDEIDAINQVAAEENIHPNNLYAIKHTIIARDISNIKAGKMEASSFSENDFYGITVNLPNNKSVIIICNESNNKIEIISEEDSI
jgi:sulfur transfer complex TusBCD TusB component (DsrH family)